TKPGRATINVTTCAMRARVMAASIATAHKNSLFLSVKTINYMINTVHKTTGFMYRSKSTRHRFFCQVQAENFLEIRRDNT
ncbi:TPA: hypothetical protein ACHJ09_005424, partial [Escherichia coli]